MKIRRWKTKNGKSELKNWNKNQKDGNWKFDTKTLILENFQVFFLKWKNIAGENEKTISKDDAERKKIKNKRQKKCEKLKLNNENKKWC